MKSASLPSSVEPLPSRLKRRDGLLLSALLCGPLALAIEEGVSYYLAPTACELGAPWILHLTFGIALLISMGGAALAHGVGRRLPPGSIEQGGLWASRARFMALAGEVSGWAFALVVVALEVPNWMLGVCQ